MERIKLNFINRSSDTNNNSVVIFQKNLAVDFNESVIAWKVIENCDRMENHPFIFPVDHTVATGDSYGNYTPQLTASKGQVFEMVKSVSGDLLQASASYSQNPNEIEVKNNLPTGSIDANCYRDGKLLATKTNVSPGQKAVFEFQPKIYIGIAPEVQEGDVLSAEILSQINGEINLFGIKSADIVMTGGGFGKTATPLEFRLENVK